ncbi:hypothetical protein [Paenibacillus sp. FSL R7-0179]|uniref:hypothetical protein n=1 Tax=Paenibacillus sp. FSL R7-0179 TaxID=2921672 RepID=UPI0030F877E0
MKTTGNLGLKKPDGTDIVDITDLNGNMDILDTAVKAAQDHAADTVKHITATERSAWNAKASTAVATTTSAGLMAAADKSKLDGVAQGANNYVHPNHTGYVTSSSDGVTAISPGVIVNADVNAAAGIDASKIGTGVVSNAEFGYLDGVTAGIQGQINGKANLTTTPQQTTTTITYYVRLDGSDSNSGLTNTAAGAFKTVQKAINSIPQIVNHTVIVNVAAGTYAEEVVISGFSGRGVIQINGDSMLSTSRTVQYVSVVDCLCRVEVIGLNASQTTGAAFNIAGSSNILLYRCVVISSATTYGFFIDCSKVYVNECQVSNRLWGVYAHVNADVLVQSLYGTGCTNGLSAAYGGVIAIQSSTLTATSMYSTAYGGTIHVEGKGVINPWGDNTTNLRPTVWAYRDNSAQIIEANVFRALVFNVKSTDNNYSYNTTTGYFTANQTGWYHFKIRVICTTIPAGIAVFIRIVHGEAYRDIAYAHGFNTDLEVGGDIKLYMGAGDTFVPQIVSGVATTVMPSAQYSRFESIRLS